MRLDNINIKNEAIKKVVIKSIIGLIISLIVFPILAIIGFCNEPGRIIGFFIYFVLTSYAAYELASILPFPNWVKYYLPIVTFLFFFFTFPDTKQWLTTKSVDELSYLIRQQYVFKVGVEGLGYLIVLAIVALPFAFVRWNNKTPIMFVILYVATILIGVVGKNLFYLNSGNFWIMMVIFGTVICTDTFAYFGGRLFHNKVFKNHKLAPRISPNKSIEGAIIGYFFGFMVAFFCLFFLKEELYSNVPLLNNSKQNRDIVIPIMALSMPIVSIIGDLLFSGVKRFVNVKDFASIIPEHGGVLDRLDAAIVVSFFYLLIFV